MIATPSATEQTNRDANLAAIHELRECLARAAEGGGPAAHERNRARGKLPVRQWIGNSPG